MVDIIVSAPGKVILHGEHAVVYGKVAIAASLNLRTYLRLRDGKANTIKINLPNININVTWNVDDIQSKLALPLGEARVPAPASEEILTKLRDIAGVNTHETDTKQLAVITSLYLYCAIAGSKGCLPAVDMMVVSKQPVSAGLGSSAAYSVCLVASLLQYSGITSPNKDGTWSEEDTKLINSWAYFGEKILHGNPSGIDNSVSTLGGALKFQSGRTTPLTRMPVLRILLVNTGVPRSTKVLVANCRERYNKYPDIIQPILDSIEAISLRCEKLFVEMAESPTQEKYQTLQDFIDINQRHLGALGVNHPALEDIVKTAAKYHLHAKLTGAGGGGCAFILITPETSEKTLSDLRTEFEGQGRMCWVTSVGSRGVTSYDMLDSQNGHLHDIFS